MAEAFKFDLTDLPPLKKGEGKFDLIGLPPIDEDKDLKAYVESVVGPSRGLPGAELKQDEAPSFIKRVWRQITEPDFQKRRAESALSVTIGREKGISPSKTEPPGIIDIGVQGFQQSVTGMAIRATYKDKGYEGINQEAFKRMRTFQRSLYQAAMFAGDVPFFIAGALIGGAAGGPAAPFTAVGGAFALPAGLRKVYADKIEKGEVTSFKDFWGRLTGAVGATLKGEITGIATRGAGSIGGKLALPAEIFTMTAVGSALEGHMPEPEDFLDAAIIIGGLRGATKIRPVIADIYKKTGKTPKEVLKDIEVDPTISQDILDIGNRRIEEAERAKGEPGAPEPTLPKAYEPLRDPPISEGGEAPPTRQRKFIKTVEEAQKTDPDLVEKVKEIDPQEYVVEPNIESLAKAENRIEAEGLEKTIDFVLSDAELNAEKGATFITLMDKFQAAGDIERALQMTEAYDMQLREAGRFIQAASIWTKSSPAGFIRWAEKQIEATRSRFGWLDTLFKNKPEFFTFKTEKGGERKFVFEPEVKARLMARMVEIQAMKDGPDKTDAMLEMIDEVAQFVPPSVTEMIDAYRYQNMLSSPRTQMRNIGENLENTFLTRPVDVTTRGAIDWAKASLFGKERQSYVADVPVYMKAAINALPNATNAFISVMKMEKGTTIGKPDVGLEVGTEFQRARMAQIPKPLTIISRFMEGSDKFFSALIGAGEFAIQKKAGATDAQAYARSAELAEKYLYRNKLDPSDADVTLFGQALVGVGKIVNDARKIPTIGPVVKWSVPFIRTPMNKGAQMVARSPVGTLGAGIQAILGKKISPETQARIISGSIVTGLGAVFAMTDRTTWVAPSDPELKKWFYFAGRKPFSVRIGRNWIPIWYLGPYALAFGFPAAVKYYAQDEKTALTKDYTEKTLATIAGTVRFLGSQTSTRSVGALFGALSGDFDYNFPSTVAFTGGQVIPAQSLIRYLNAMIDPVLRRPKGFWENVIKDIPIMSKELEPRFDPRGQEVTRDTTNYFTPYDIGKVDLEADKTFQTNQFMLRYKYLKSQMDSVSRKVISGRMKSEKMPDEFNKIMKGMKKIAPIKR